MSHHTTTACSTSLSSHIEDTMTRSSGSDNFIDNGGSEWFSDDASIDAPSQTCTSEAHTDSAASDFSIAREENKAVVRSKLLMLFCLFCSGTIIGVLTHYILSNEEQRDFEVQFLAFTDEISRLLHQEASNVFLSVERLATTVTSFSLETNVTWPFLTVPHFEIRGTQANDLALSLMTVYSPLVDASTRKQWESYSVKNQGWIQEGVEFNIELHEDFIEDGTFVADPIHDYIYRFEDNEDVAENGDGPYLPVWQLAPAPHDDSIVNFNLLSHPVFDRAYRGVLHSMQPVLSEVIELDWLYGGSVRDNVTHPHSVFMQPVFRSFKKDAATTDPYLEKDVAGFVMAIMPWDNYFMNVLPQGADGTMIVLRDTCNKSFTYIINGPEAVYAGEGDRHDPRFDYMATTMMFTPFSHLNVSHNYGCSDGRGDGEFFVDFYPTQVLRDSHDTEVPALYTLTVVLVFFFTSLGFLLYDYLVQRRQDKVVTTAKRSNAILSSLFPGTVRDRLMEDAGRAEANHKKNNTKNVRFGVAKTQLKSFLDDHEENENNGVFGSKPIADLFPSATVMFADIVGFTAWSSVREPTQVFQLLETLYHAFDEIAKRRRVFKVETIGDCYVAVTGLPEPRVDHAVVMARFARDCSGKMNDLSKKLEVTLGPDTGDLSMRIGLNSGPVTAGVLRGEKSRFQLFGDTVNTAARMESNGERNRIHISHETAEFLKQAGKSHWVIPRENKIIAKGKGELQTYWLEIKGQSGPSSRSGVSTSDTSSTGGGYTLSPKQHPKKQKSTKQPPKIDPIQEIPGPSERGSNRGGSNSSVVREDSLTDSVKKQLLTDKVERLVRWNSDVMLKLLKQIVVRRKAASRHKESGGFASRSTNFSSASLGAAANLTLETPEGCTVLDEVREIITLPRFDAKAASKQEEYTSIDLGPDVTSQLRDFVTIIATMYRDNPFHNFEHASHVTMSVVKLLSRIVAPDDIIVGSAGDENSDLLNRNLHDHTYGITSDPLTQFAVVFSALIHDVDHQGVPNAQLVKEKSRIASVYKNKSVAEQNSVDLAWELLMDENFAELRSVIYTTQSELKRFRQLVVNTVLATDIVDKELKELRNQRWDRAFHSSSTTEGGYDPANNNRNDTNRKATIVIEHLIQASDVAHTMQHWHIYRKWNERFFQEMLHAYQSGRAEKDPTEFWYRGEIGFFDFYIIPLVKKLKDCGVFGVSSDEYLNYAMANRKEWEEKGEQVVAEMVSKYRGKRFSYLFDQCKLGENEKRRSFYLEDD